MNTVHDEEEEKKDMQQEHTIPVKGLDTARKLAHEYLTKDPTLVAVIRPDPKALEEYRNYTEVHDDTSRESCFFCQPHRGRRFDGYTLTLYPPGSQWHSPRSRR